MGRPTPYEALEAFHIEQTRRAEQAFDPITHLARAVTLSALAICQSLDELCAQISPR